ncbi:MAG: 16S rRNA (cytosine(967)-C(5))-methyltransferase RsmB [Xanthomonadales bacterium]|nr:16S rRNA (cytosine(967)-C(5))-methyltransferase RsmB [Xanthomonadales bacterium]
MKTARLTCLRVLLATSPAKGKKSMSLDAALANYLPKLEEPRDRALTQRLAYATLRWLGATEYFSGKLLKKPLKNKDRDIYLLIQLGLAQLWREEIPAHAAVHETAAVARGLGKPWAVSLINGVLRNFQRQREALEAGLAQSTARWSSPDWLIQRLQAAWPEHWQAILSANSQQAPMWLRVNLSKHSREDYLKQLQAEGIAATAGGWTKAAIRLEQACPVNRLPGFSEGAVSVQDSAAQLAAEILNPQAGERLLDACAAPGSKTCHLLELEPKISAVTALDNSGTRLVRVSENLQRLSLDAKVLTGDATKPSDWWDGQSYDRILLDAPCSSLGVIRRHPDINWRRQPADIDTVQQIQFEILSSCWKLLKPSGKLLYVTCSVLPTENQAVIERWLATVDNARTLPLSNDWGLSAGAGRQILPGEDEHGNDGDGFFYCLLEKNKQ